jgi:hypothetical protein
MSHPNRLKHAAVSAQASSGREPSTVKVTLQLLTSQSFNKRAVRVRKLLRRLASIGFDPEPMLQSEVGAD